MARHPSTPSGPRKPLTNSGLFKHPQKMDPKPKVPKATARAKTEAHRVGTLKSGH